MEVQDGGLSTLSNLEVDNGPSRVLTRRLSTSDSSLEGENRVGRKERGNGREERGGVWNVMGVFILRRLQAPGPYFTLTRGQYTVGLLV